MESFNKSDDIMKLKAVYLHTRELQNYDFFLMSFSSGCLDFQVKSLILMCS